MNTEYVDNTKSFYIVIFLIAIFSIWQYYNHQENILMLKTETNQTNNIIKNICESSNICKNNQSSKPQENEKNKNNNSPPINIEVVDHHPPSMPIDILREYDYRALYDPLVPPLKRDEYSSFIPSVYTRGYPEGYKKMGLLIDETATNDDKYKFMILVGRPKFPRSTIYEYFATENKHESALKFELTNIQKELYTGDDITISELGKTYKVRIDRNLGFDYSPFLY